jgi:hypothetical protein
MLLGGDRPGGLSYIGLPLAPDNLHEFMAANQA